MPGGPGVVERHLAQRQDSPSSASGSAGTASNSISSAAERSFERSSVAVPTGSPPRNDRPPRRPSATIFGGPPIDLHTRDRPSVRSSDRAQRSCEISALRFQPSRLPRQAGQWLCSGSGTTRSVPTGASRRPLHTPAAWSPRATGRPEDPRPAEPFPCRDRLGSP